MLNPVRLERDGGAVLQIDLPYVRPADVLAVLKQAVSPRTYDSSERFPPLTDLTQFQQAFTENRFRFRCPVGRVNPVTFDVAGEVVASSSGTTLRLDIRLAYPWLRYLASAVMLVWSGFAAWTLPYGVGLIPLALFLAFVLYVEPVYVANRRRELEVSLRELRPFLLARMPP